MILSLQRIVTAVLAAAVVSSVCSAEKYREPWRPQFHFTPATNWMNDPNGMVFYEGEYHLFYQYNPFGDRWGHMSWGHAVTKDLVHWEHLPVALYEENDVMIFSGSAVVDWSNTSGFGRDGKPPMVAIYTGHYTKKPLQNQNLAFSNDRGRTWTKYAGNPVLDLGEQDFRDPKVFWHEPTQCWVMVVSWPVHRKVRFYGSANLKEWTHLSDFGPAGSTEGIWECPDLFPLKAGGATKWVLIVNVGSGAPAGGSGGQYFVGDFDGRMFQPDGKALKGSARWLDHGPDFYAAVTWSDVPKRDGRRIALGWMSNWRYANDVPSSPWRSAMSVPRELRLQNTDNGWRLCEQPVRELWRLREKPRLLRGASAREANQWIRKQAIRASLWEAIVELERITATDTVALLLTSAGQEEVRIECDAAHRLLQMDRTQSGRVGFHRDFPGKYKAPLEVKDGRLSLHLLVDISSVEIFANKGESALTALVLPEHGPFQLSLACDSPDTRARIRSLSLWELTPAWK